MHHYVSKNKNFFLLILIPLYFLMDGINKFRHMVPVSSGLKILAICVLLSFGLLIIITRRLKTDNSVLIVSFLLFTYLFFRPILDTFTIIRPLAVLNSAKFYLPFLSLLFLLLWFFQHKVKQETLSRLLLYLNLTFSVLVVFESGKYFFITGNKKRYKLVTEKIDPLPVHQPTKPNIYFFVLDEYAGMESIKKYFHFDNTPFVDSLKKRNFFVAQNPNSNYNLTWISMLSTLQMSYIKNIDRKEFSQVTIYGNAAENIKENNVISFFNQINYNIINYTFFRLNHCHSAPFLMLPIEERLLLDKTFGSSVSNGLFQNIPSNTIQLILNTHFAKIYKYNEHIISQTKQKIKENEKPVFLYSHLLMPHLPYMKDENGNTRNFSDAYKELRKKGYPKSYTNYLQYTNNLMLEFSDSIIQKNDPAIIIIMSDHGYRWEHGKRNPLYDFNNFLAVYSSTGNYSNFSDTTNTVNLFRIILNNYFDQKLPLLENKLTDIREGHL